METKQNRTTSARRNYYFFSNRTVLRSKIEADTNNRRIAIDCTCGTYIDTVKVPSGLQILIPAKLCGNLLNLWTFKAISVSVEEHIKLRVKYCKNMIVVTE